MRVPGLFGRLKARLSGCCTWERCQPPGSKHACFVHLEEEVQKASLIQRQEEAGLDFIWAEGFVFSHVDDEGIINACAGNLLQYRKQVGAENIQIFADIKRNIEVKHAVKIPVLTGCGVALENVRNYLDANALIIGSYFKKEGYWVNGVDSDRVKKFMEHISKLRE